MALESTSSSGSCFERLPEVYDEVGTGGQPIHDMLVDKDVHLEIVHRSRRMLRTIRLE